MRLGEYRGFRIRYQRAGCWEAVIHSPSGHLVGERVRSSLEEGEAGLLRRAAALIDARIACEDVPPRVIEERVSTTTSFR